MFGIVLWSLAEIFKTCHSLKEENNYLVLAMSLGT
jgi:hypothetical protein